MSDLHEFADDDTRTEDRHRKRRRRHRRRRAVTLLLILVLVIGGAGYLVLGPLKGIAADLHGNTGDYKGSGHGEVSVVVSSGASGRTVANDLVDKGVIKSSDPFLDALSKSGDQLQPGRYVLHRHMSGSAAVKLLQNPVALPTFTVPEGYRRMQMVPAIHKVSGLPVAEIKKALKAKPQKYGLPADLPSIEGYLFPATYKVKPHETATEIVQTMVDRMQAALTDAGVRAQDQRTVLTKASLVQAESPGDYATRRKIARVFDNRLKDDNKETDGKLQSDATVSYIFGTREDASTTKKQRASKSPYNTYRHKGLPPGPINSPGLASIKAADDPASGPWMYFVTVNPDTGKTKFATTYKQHQKHVKQYQAWLKKHHKGDHRKAKKNGGKS
ncbi:endolytic transglycosylase MltG [Spelaeicoccus albus]|uniref:Endolytic murein transglycosylase n=1 Tax=Spelaeicoccus albus TaxID=1280376 RepID=A0A7Z0D4D3_9MICO|nr:endolytic transglycosylase MltG [Spelaeicoccus albus]NYI68620.1 UPF0755 protein [Spelaeicoccus albus]